MNDSHLRSIVADPLARCIALVVLLAVGPACAVVSYRHDDAPSSRPPPRSETLYYKVRPLQGVSMGGIDALKRAMKENEVFARSELGDIPASQGVSVDVYAQWLPPSLGAMVYGYVDLSLLAILPLYSDSMGYDLQYTVYRDGRKIRIYEYPVRRRVFMWLPVLPFVWVNLLTGNETDAFADVTRRFFFEASRDGAFDGRDALPSAPVSASDRQAPSS